jgi:hypothetical protein
MNENISTYNKKTINNDIFCCKHAKGGNIESKDKNLTYNYIYRQTEVYLNPII